MVKPFSSNLESGTAIYTAPKDGFLIYSWVQLSRRYVEILVNGYSVCDYAGTGASSSNPVAGVITLPLKKGDVVTSSVAFSSTNAILKTTCFVPLDN